MPVTVNRAMLFTRSPRVWDIVLMLLTLSML